MIVVLLEEITYTLHGIGATADRIKRFQNFW